jgi:hypothetical protein
MTVRITVPNIGNLVAKLKKLPPKVQTAFYEGLLKEAGAIMDNAQTRVPVVTGRLRSSAFIRDEKRKGKRDITLGYDAPYAVYVHEIPYKGTTTKGLPGAMRNGKGYKWVQKAVNFALKGARERLINVMRAAMGGR